MKAIGLALIAATIAAAAVSVSFAGAANGQLEQILNNMQKAAANIKTIRANMEIVKRDTAIGGTEKYSGIISFKHVTRNSDKVRIDYTAPKGQVVWVVNDDIILYQEATGTVYMTSKKAQASKNSDLSFVATPYSSVPELKRQYNIVHLGDEDGRAKLELTPKAKSSLQKMILWVDQSLWLPTKYQVVESNSTTTTFTLTGLEINKGIPDKVFVPSYPPGTKKVRR